MRIYGLCEKSRRRPFRRLGSRREFFECIAETGTWGRSPRTRRKDPCISAVRPSVRRIDRSSRGWPRRRNSKQTRVGKRPARMSAGLLTNGRKERRDDERREPHKKRKEFWPRYEIANFFPSHRNDFHILLFNEADCGVCARLSISP